MKSIIEKQRLIQKRFAAERGMQDPCKIETVGEFVDYVREMREYLNMELEELLCEVDWSGAARKPWKEKCEDTRRARIEQFETELLRAEAMDALCFMMNICLACGVDETNVDSLFQSILEKNRGRLDNGY